MSNPFSEDVIAAIARHMNEDHLDDNVLIVRALGGQPDVQAARMHSCDANGIDFVAELPDVSVDVRVPWIDAPISERGQVRVEVVKLYDAACAAAGVTPRPH